MSPKQSAPYLLTPKGARSALDATQLDDMVRVKFGSKDGLTLRFSADCATTREQCKLFLQEIEDEDYRVGLWMEDHLRMDDHLEAREMSKVEGMKFYDAARRYRQEKSRSSLSAIPEFPDFLKPSGREKQEAKWTRSLRHNYGPVHLSKYASDWPSRLKRTHDTRRA